MAAANTSSDGLGFTLTPENVALLEEAHRYVTTLHGPCYDYAALYLGYCTGHAAELPAGGSLPLRVTRDLQDAINLLLELPDGWYWPRTREGRG